MFYNCGCYIGSRRAKTKKELKDALAANPSTVYFDGTSIDKKVVGYGGTAIPEDITLTVVGPDPFKARQWYANVSRKADGTLKVS